MGWMIRWNMIRRWGFMGPRKRTPSGFRRISSAASRRAVARYRARRPAGSGHRSFQRPQWGQRTRGDPGRCRRRPRSASRRSETPPPGQHRSPGLAYPGRTLVEDQARALAVAGFHGTEQKQHHRRCGRVLFFGRQNLPGPHDPGQFSGDVTGQLAQFVLKVYGALHGSAPGVFSRHRRRYV